jgi:hypothetical protein
MPFAAISSAARFELPPGRQVRSDRCGGSFRVAGRWLIPAFWPGQVAVSAMRHGEKPPALGLIPEDDVAAVGAGDELVPSGLAPLDRRCRRRRP